MKVSTSRNRILCRKILSSYLQCVVIDTQMDASILFSITSCQTDTFPEDIAPYFSQLGGQPQARIFAKSRQNCGWPSSTKQTRTPAMKVQSKCFLKFQTQRPPRIAMFETWSQFGSVHGHVPIWSHLTAVILCCFLWYVLKQWPAATSKTIW